MDKNFKGRLKIIGHSMICIGLGLAVGFHILPYLFRTNDDFVEGQISILKSLKTGVCIVRGNDILFYPDSTSTFNIVLKRGD